MSRKYKNNLAVQVLVLGTLLASPCRAGAQRGTGGGHVGGGSPVGGGLSGSGGKATGLDVKDDLKTFHAALAIQATSEQVIDYNLMVKSTEAAKADLRALSEEAAGKNKASELAARDKALGQSLEAARTRNRKFPEKLSEQQKSGLKEILKKLTKTDAELAQQARVLDEQFEAAREVGPPFAASVRSLDETLTRLLREQSELGEEMSIAAGGGGLRIRIPPVTNLVTFANRAITITTVGIISKTGSAAEPGTFKLELMADESNLQDNITEVLHGKLDKDDACGERITIRTGDLTPAEPESLLVVRLHYERWACFGRSTMNEMAEGNAMLEVKFRLEFGKDGGLRLETKIGQVDADGLIGELLRSGSLGETLRDKTAEVIFAAVNQGANYRTLFPAGAQANVALQGAEFSDDGLGKLMVVLNGEVKLSPDEVASLTRGNKTGDARAGDSKSQVSAQSGEQR